MSEIKNHHTASHGGYEVTFHPAFASRCCIGGIDEPEVELYAQKKTHRLGKNEKHPTKHKIRLRGGAHGRDLTFDIDDPHHHVHKITVELYPAGRGAGMTDKQPVEVMTVMNMAEVCPPNCGDTGGDDTGGGG